MFIRNLNQNLFRFAALSLVLFSGTLSSQATVLNPGATISLLAAPEPKSGHLLAVTNFQISAVDFSGKLMSKVWVDDEANPFAGLTFGYRLISTGECDAALGWFALSGFAGLDVDVNYFAGGEAPRIATRSNSGHLVSFGFFDRNGEESFESGSSSAWLIVQTSAQVWGVNQFVGLGSETMVAAAFAPVAVPEPTVVTLVALAGVAVLSRRKKA